jgi:hypothetical protein
VPISPALSTPSVLADHAAQVSALGLLRPMFPREISRCGMTCTLPVGTDDGGSGCRTRGATCPALRFAQFLGRFVTLNLCNSIRAKREPQRMVRNSTV